MATVYRKTVTRKFPVDAEIITRKGEQLARWKDRSGKTRTAPVITSRSGTLRIATKAGTYTAKYLDGSGIVREVATGCRSKDAAISVLNDLFSRAEKVRAKIITAAEADIADHQDTLLQTHFDDYLTHHRNKGTSDSHRERDRSPYEAVAAGMPTDPAW